MARRPQPSQVVEVFAATPPWGAAAVDVLGEREQARMAALPAGSERAAFVSARVLLRTAVGRYWQVPAADVTVRATCPRCGGPHGRPVVASPPGCPRLHVSLARTDGFVLVAVTELAPVGVDVERVDRVERVADLAATALTGAERDALDELAPDERPAALAVLWTRKEAALKAIGVGLALSPSSVQMVPPWTSPIVANGPLGGELMQVSDLDLGPHHRAAVALVGPTTPAVRVDVADDWTG